MERLAGIDAQFLYMETPAAHMHTIKAAILEPATGVEYTLDLVRRDLEERLHLLPPFRRRIVEVPFSFHHPAWIEDPHFDLTQHLHTMSVSPPGGAREMDACISAIASVPLERSRPLWEVWILYGLAHGRVAAVAKIHHAVADGVAVASLLANVLEKTAVNESFQTTPGDVSTPGSPARTWQAEAVPSPASLLRDAMQDHLRGLHDLPGLVRRTASGLRSALARSSRASHKPPRPLLDTPNAPFNGALTPKRAFSSIALELEAIRVVRRSFGVTLNDVLLALVAGSLRTALQERGALPARSLTAEVPIAVVSEPGPRLSGNRLSNLFTSLCSDVEDPVERLAAIHETMRAAKAQLEAIGPELYRQWTEYTPPGPTRFAMQAYSRLGLAARHRPAVNVIVSCVPGPRQKLCWPSGALEAIYSVGPIIEGTALNITAWSYVDRLYIGVLTCPDLWSEPERISLGLQQALDDLLARAEPTGLASKSEACRDRLDPGTMGE